MERKIKLFQADAFTDELFGGNPAAVCYLDNWLSDKLMQNIAAENNLAETAFVVPMGDQYEIRWFTPSTEVELCGHATLASAHVLFEFYENDLNEIVFKSRERGILKVRKSGEVLTLDFPVDVYKKSVAPKGLYESLGLVPSECYKGMTDYLLVYKSENEIKSINPDFKSLKEVNARGVIVTAEGSGGIDFVSRFFAPASGVDEDPVTGSAHTTLTPFWSERLGRMKLRAVQLSKRKGYLECELKIDRVEISGKVRTYLTGEIHI
ncbi:MAG TPA: PhzF family phenazine biosynthesis protein [Ignavibacteria bacterium]|nr:PhzF family phenazine biosynthesis protein [Ignavibacteria bacterium]